MNPDLLTATAVIEDDHRLAFSAAVLARIELLTASVAEEGLYRASHRWHVPFGVLGLVTDPGLPLASHVLRLTADQAIDQGLEALAQSWRRKLGLPGDTSGKAVPLVKIN